MPNLHQLNAVKYIVFPAVTLVTSDYCGLHATDAVRCLVQISDFVAVRARVESRDLAGILEAFSESIPEGAHGPRSGLLTCHLGYVAPQVLPLNPEFQKAFSEYSIRFSMNITHLRHRIIFIHVIGF